MDNNRITIKLFEAFAGIGAQFKALKNIQNKMNWNIQSVGMIEWYVDAIIAYLAIHHNEFTSKEKKLIEGLEISTNSKEPISKVILKKLKTSLTAHYLNASKTKYNNLFDITKASVKLMPKNIDIFTYSFPCQDLSIQGKGKGMSKNSKTRSGLLWEVERIITEMHTSFKEDEMPKYLLLENVKNMVSGRHKHDYYSWLTRLEQLGYRSKTYVLNAKHFGSAQNRVRVFGLTVRKSFMKKVNFEFTDLENVELKPKVISDILDHEHLREKDLSYLNQYKTSDETLTKNGIKRKSLLNYTTFNSETYVYHKDFAGPTLTASGANSRIKIDLNWDKNTNEMDIISLNPQEAYCYMGFTLKDYKKVNRTGLLSDLKTIYTAGNSISVQVLEHIFASLKFEKGDN